MFLVIVASTDFVPINDFAELDAVAAPTDFGLLIIMSEDSVANKAITFEVLESIEIMDPDGETDISLYFVTMNASGYSEMANIAGKFGGFPTVVSLVGHCGFLELDPEFLASEIEDAWYTWGGGSTQGICNYCTRCN